MIRLIPFAISCVLLCCTTHAIAQSSELQRLAEELASTETFSHAGVGICVMSGSGELVAEINKDRLMVPASNLKLLSTGVALHTLGTDYRFRTDIAYDGRIEDGTLHGNLYITGHGDPTTASKDSIATPIGSLFSRWEECIRAAGIRKIQGHIIGDGRWLDGTAEEPTWLLSDIGTYYGTGATGLMFYENMLSFSVSPGERPGTPVRIEQHYPSCSWMTFRHDCTTGEKGTGDRLYMYTSPFAPVADIKGTFGVDRGQKRVDFSNKFPEYTCAVYFKNHLHKNGITCTAGAADFRFRTEWTGGRHIPEGIGTDGDSLKIIGTTLSPSLGRIAFETNHESNNLYAEALLRTLGKELNRRSCYDSSHVAMNAVLKSMHLGCHQGLHMQDGSGLSRQNLVSADFMCRFLGAMTDSPCFEEYLRSLPVPGGNGTLSYNMKGYPETLRSRIRVKSGSMSGIRCYSGYILPPDYIFKAGEKIPQEVKDRIVIFSVLTNNCISPSWQVRPALDRFIAEMTSVCFYKSANP